MRHTIFLLAALLLSACSQTPKSRYQHAQDSAPHRTPTAAEQVNPVPRHEPFSRQGNRAYHLFGEHYTIIDNVQGYTEQGVASWYGRKFHGHLTANGEYFDMFSMTAAHKSLPLPIYVKVTNLDNNREAIVRVNDRGPFHGNRIIDLSYAAAYRLGITDTGTANVQLEVITPPLKDIALKDSDLKNGAPKPPQAESSTVVLTPSVMADKTNEQLFIQMVASSNLANTEQLKQHLQERYALTAIRIERNGIHRLLLGPFSELEAAQWLDKLQNAGYADVFRTQENLSPQPLP